jgi:tape measure domain-containing protein
MAIKDSVLSIIIKAKDLATKTFRRVKTNLKDVDEAGVKTSSSMANLAKRFIALAAAAVGLQQIKNIFAGILKTGDQFERLGLQMEQVMGSIQAGEQATEWIKEFTRSTPLQIEQVTEVFLRLKNFGLDPMNGSLQSIVDQNEKMGGGMDRLLGISNALGQAWTKQKLQGEEILQLAERSVPVWDLLAESTGKSVQELQKLSSEGKLGRDVIQQLINTMGGQSTGAAAANMSLLSGLVSNLRGEWTEFRQAVADSGILDFAKEQLDSLLKTVVEMRENGSLQAWANSVSSALVSLSKLIGTTISLIAKFSGTLSVLLSYKVASWVLSAASALGSYIVQLSAAIAANISATGSFRILQGAVTKLQGAFLGLGAFVVGWEIGTVLREKFAIVRKAGVVMAAGVSIALSTIQAAWETTKAVFTDTTIESALERHAQRMSQIKSIYGELLTEAEATGSGIAKSNRNAASAATVLSEAEQAVSSALETSNQRSKEIIETTRGLISTYAASNAAGNSLAEGIKRIGDIALSSGKIGVEALSIALEDLAVKGKATREAIDTNLVAYLESLTPDQFKAFSEELVSAIEGIDGASAESGVRLRFLQEILEQVRSAATQFGVDVLDLVPNLDAVSESAKNLGFDLKEMLTGIDAPTRESIKQLGDLGAQLKIAGLESDQTSAIIAKGLATTLKSLDSSEEVEATIKALEKLRNTQVINDQQLKEFTGQVKTQWQEVRNETKETADQTKEKQRETRDSIGETVNKQKELTDEVDRSGQAANALADAYNAIREPVIALGPAAEELFNKLQGINSGAVSSMGDEFADLRAEIEGANETIDQNRALVTASFTGLTAFLRQSSVNAAEVTKQYFEQKLAINELQLSFEQGAITAAQFASRARAAASSTSLLSRTDLTSLRSSIEQAEQSMESLQNSTESTLNSLQRELAQIRGDTLEAERLRFQSRIADLEARLQQAQESGDAESIANARSALSVAKEIFSTKKKQIIAEQRAQKDRAAEQARDEQQEKVTRLDTSDENKPTEKATVTNIQRAPEVVIRLEGPTSTAQVKTKDPQGLLDVLAESGRSTA